MEVGILLRLDGVMNLILILSHLFSIQRREFYKSDFVKEKFNIGLYSDIYWPVSFKIGMML